MRWKKVRTYDDPVAWVRRVAWNLATSRFRRQKTSATNFLRRPREQHIAGPGPDGVALTRALAALPPNHRRAVVMHHMGQMTVAEIAAQEGVADDAVASWLSRGREALAVQLSDSTKGSI